MVNWKFTIYEVCLVENCSMIRGLLFMIPLFLTEIGISLLMNTIILFLFTMYNWNLFRLCGDLQSGIRNFIVQSKNNGRALGHKPHACYFCSILNNLLSCESSTAIWALSNTAVGSLSFKMEITNWIFFSWTYWATFINILKEDWCPL